MIKLNTFDHIATFITSINAVIVAMFALLIFLMIETTILFHRELATAMPGWLAISAGIAIAFAFELTVLVFTANSNHEKGGWKIQHVIAIFHFFINTYFWKAFDVEVIEVKGWTYPAYLTYFYRIFLSFMFSYLAYQYAALFSKKFRERFTQISERISLVELQKQIGQLKSTIGELMSEKGQLKKETDQLISDKVDLQVKIDQVQKEKHELQLSLNEALSKLRRGKKLNGESVINQNI